MLLCPLQCPASHTNVFCQHQTQFAEIVHSLVGQLNVALCNKIHVVVADLLSCCRSRIFLRIRRRRWRWSKITSHPSTTPSARSRLKHSHRFRRQSSRCRHLSRRLRRLLISRSEPANSLTQSPCCHSFLPSRSRRIGTWMERISVWIPVPASVRIWRGWKRARMWAMVRSSSSTVLRLGWEGGSLETVSLRRRLLAVPDLLRRMREWLNMVRVQSKIVEVRNLTRIRLNIASTSCA